MPLHAAAVRAGNYLMVAAKYGDRATARVELADAIRAVRNVYALSGDYLGFENGMIVRLRPTVELWREAGPKFVATFPINYVGFECDDTLKPEYPVGAPYTFMWSQSQWRDDTAIPNEWYERLCRGLRHSNLTGEYCTYSERGSAYKDLSQAAIGWAIDANR